MPQDLEIKYSRGHRQDADDPESPSRYGLAGGWGRSAGGKKLLGFSECLREALE